MARSSLSIDQILVLLEEAPARIAGMSAGLSPAQLCTPPGPGEWSANDVLAHLRSCADMWGGSIITIISVDGPTIRAVNPRTWIRQTDYPNLDFGSSLRAYTAQRAELLAVLKPLPRDDWSRPATVTGAGSPLVRTVYTYAESLAIHERPHIKQIARIVDAMRTECLHTAEVATDR